MPYRSITENEAREIIRLRISEAKENQRLTPLRRFAEQLHELGVTHRLYSPATLTNILKGHTYPHLKDVDGKPIVWENVPSRQRGRTSPDEGQGLPGRVRALERRLEAVERQMGVKEDEP